jgi:FkbM family methyltransferase
VSGRAFEWLNRPEYIYQPDKLFKRVLGKGHVNEGEEVVELPWNIELEVDSSETIGRILSHHGIFELPVVEAIFRLVDPSDCVLDVGANIGYMAAVSLSAGAKKVISFEPHPTLFARLSRNVDRWQKKAGNAGRVDARQVAVSAENGEATLHIPKYGFKENQMLATLESQPDQDAFDEIRVPTMTLDSVINETSDPVGVLKIDIEGHELQAFKGCRESFGQKKIRDVIYEEFEGISSGASKLLAGYGYSILGLRKTIFGPVLIDKLEVGKPHYGDHNFVATLDPMRVKKRMAPRGYISMSPKDRARFQAARA